MSDREFIVTPLLTARQRRFLQFVREYYTERGLPPTLSEIAVGLGLSPRSIEPVVGCLFELQRAGWVRRVPGRHRAIELLDPATGRAA